MIFLAAQTFDQNYTEYKAEVAAYEAWQTYFASYNDWTKQYDDACACLCNATDVNGNRFLYASCCVSVPNESCTNGPEVCRNLKICSSTQFQSLAPNSTRDRECADLTVCTPYLQYESVSPTATSNRGCSTLEACPAKTHEQFPPPNGVYYAPRYCDQDSVCIFPHVEIMPPTPTSDRLCA